MQAAAAEAVLMRELRSLVFKPAVWRFLAGAAHRLRDELANDSAADMQFASVPLDTYGAELPPEIRSSWIFVMKHAAAFRPERHPNSIQRMFSLWNTGIMDVWTNGQCRSQELIVSRTDPGLSIPVLTWHRPRAPYGNWAVVSFHTAEADELVEELGDPTVGGVQSSRRYRDGVASERVGRGMRDSN